jgi:hypothetical protein
MLRQQHIAEGMEAAGTPAMPMHTSHVLKDEPQAGVSDARSEPYNPHCNPIMYCMESVRSISTSDLSNGSRKQQHRYSNRLHGVCVKCNRTRSVSCNSM